MSALYAYTCACMRVREEDLAPRLDEDGHPVKPIRLMIRSFSRHLQATCDVCGQPFVMIDDDKAWIAAHMKLIERRNVQAR
jgi:hypothetical protein